MFSVVPFHGQLDVLFYFSSFYSSMDTTIFHTTDMASPMKVTIAQLGEYAGGRSVFENLCICKFVLSSQRGYSVLFPCQKTYTSADSVIPVHIVLTFHLNVLAGVFFLTSPYCINALHQRNAGHYIWHRLGCRSRQNDDKIIITLP